LFCLEQPDLIRAKSAQHSEVPQSRRCLTTARLSRGRVADTYLNSYTKPMKYTVAEAKNRLPELIKQPKQAPV